MVFNFFKPNSAIKKYRRYIGKPVVSKSGGSIGVVSEIRLNRRTKEPISIVVKMRDGSVREFYVDRDGVSFAEDRVIVGSERGDGDDIERTVKHIMAEIEHVKQRMRDLMEKLDKVSELLIKGSISEDVYKDIKDRLDRERLRLSRICGEKLRVLDEAIDEFDRKIGELERRRGELLVKRVVGDFSSEDSMELSRIEELIGRLRRGRYELVSARLELESECLG